MDYGMIIQLSRNELFRNLAVQNKGIIVETFPVKYMDLRPYLYSSTVCDFEVAYVDEMIKAIHYNKLPSTIYLGKTEYNREKIKVLLERNISHDKLPIMVATSESLINRSTFNSLFKMSYVKSSDELISWCHVLAEGLFDHPEMNLKHMIQLFSHALMDSRYILALGYEGDTPVSAGIGYISMFDENHKFQKHHDFYKEKKMGSIFMIATLKAYRGHGYGAKLTFELTQALLNKGAIFTVLDASEMGASLYLKMGYMPVGYTYRFFPNH